MYKRYFMELAYKGTKFHGWQSQPNAITVQEVINKALSTLLKDDIVCLGCGRTDTGVHATQFFMHFDTLKDDLVDEEQSFLHKLNSLIDYDIAIYRIFKVAENAHARYDAIERTYNYKIHFFKNPFLNDYSWQKNAHKDLDIDLMNEGAKHLIGRHDFSCFSKSNTDTKTNICMVREAYWKKTEQGMEFTISANRFLRNMVRAVVGTLIELGQHKMDIKGLLELMASKNRMQAGMSVPAQGLYLTAIKYPYTLE